jgi:hypothetical protein
MQREMQRQSQANANVAPARQPPVVSRQASRLQPERKQLGLLGAAACD